MTKFVQPNVKLTSSFVSLYGVVHNFLLLKILGTQCRGVLSSVHSNDRSFSTKYALEYFELDVGCL